MYRFAFLLCLLPTILEARPYEFRFTSGPSTLTEFGRDYYFGRGIETGGPINGRFTIDLPSLANVAYRVEFAYGRIWSESFPALIDAEFEIDSGWRIHFLDTSNLFGGIRLETDEHGQMTYLDFSVGQDTPDISIGLTNASWGTCCDELYTATGTWTVTPLPPLAPVPVPMGAALLLPALVALWGAAGLGRRRREPVSA